MGAGALVEVDVASSTGCEVGLMMSKMSEEVSAAVVFVEVVRLPLSSN